jgi:DNA/RNA-binding domain of Phe-tRNA-synthetase-like protein
MTPTEPRLLIASAAWIDACPNATVGALAMSGLQNPENDPALDDLMDRTATDLRVRYAGATRADLLAQPALAAYAAYYGRFDKTYHVLLQLESVALKGKALRARGALVGAMFRAELENGLLTAGHDAALVQGNLEVGVAAAGETYAGIGGREVVAAPSDMCIRDERGIISSIVYGPDDRTRLGPTTTQAIFTTYAPAGIEPASVSRHLETIAETIRTLNPGASIDLIALARGK